MLRDSLRLAAYLMHGYQVLAIFIAALLWGSMIACVSPALASFRTVVTWCKSVGIALISSHVCLAV